MVCFEENSPESIYQYIAISSGTGQMQTKKNKTNYRQISKDRFYLHRCCLMVILNILWNFEKSKSRFPDKTIIAGNVVTGEMVEELILAWCRYYKK